MTKKKREVHVVPSKDGWTVREGSTQGGRIYKSQGDAIRRAQDTAKERGTELVVHNRDGRIKEVQSYDLSEGHRTVKRPAHKGSISVGRIERAVEKIYHKK